MDPEELVTREVGDYEASMLYKVNVQLPPLGSNQVHCADDQSRNKASTQILRYDCAAAVAQR